LGNRQSFHGRTTSGDFTEEGVSMIATLIVVVILGVLVSIALSSGHGAPPPASDSGSPTTTTTTTSNIGAVATEATVTACQANYATINTAVQDYRAVNGVAPPAGTAWATSSAMGGPLLQSWPTDAKYYSITWNGKVVSVVPVQGVASHGTYGTASPATGCFAAYPHSANG